MLAKIETLLHREQKGTFYSFTLTELLHLIRQYGKLEREEYLPQGIRVEAVLPRVWAKRIQHQLEQGELKMLTKLKRQLTILTV